MACKFVVPIPVLVTPEVPVMTALTFCVVAVLKVMAPPPVVFNVPPPVRSYLKVKPRSVLTVSSVEVVLAVTVTGTLMLIEAPAAKLRIVPPPKLKAMVAVLPFVVTPTTDVRANTPPLRLYVLFVLLYDVDVLLSMTTQGVVMVPPVWFRIPTPSSPT